MPLLQQARSRICQIYWDPSTRGGCVQVVAGCSVHDDRVVLCGRNGRTNLPSRCLRSFLSCQSECVRAVRGNAHGRWGRQHRVFVRCRCNNTRRWWWWWGGRSHRWCTIGRAGTENATLLETEIQRGTIFGAWSICGWATVTSCA